MSESSASSRSVARSTRWWLICAAIVLSSPCIESFQLNMAYKPPVKSSVKKLYDQRFPADRRFVDDSSDRHKRSSSSRKSAFAGTYAPPTSTPRPSFERRMRDLVLGSPQSTPVQQRTSPSKNPRGLPQNVRHIESLEEYKEIVGNEREKVVAVRFYATYCRACKAVAPHFYQLAQQNPDIVFVDVPVTPKNQALHQGLGIPSLPYGHIYHPKGGLVEELKLTRSHISSFKKKLNSYVQGYCELAEEDCGEDSSP